MTDIWHSRPVLTHTLNFARARRVGPTAMLGSLLVRAIASTDPNLVLPPVVGDFASLNVCFAFVGPSGHGKGATEAAARAATDIPQMPELPIGSGEGLARTFAANDQGEQADRRAIFTASEVDGLAAIGSRTGSTLMATIRQLYSGEAIGAANAQKHTRLIVPRHGYRACLTVGVQPEAAAPLLADERGTAQRMVWLPVGDPDAPDTKPDEPAPFTIARHLTPVDDYTVLALPDEAVRAMEDHHLAKLRGEDVDPLDGHRMLTQAKVAAGFMILDGRTGRVTVEDWNLATRIMAISDQTRRRLSQVAVDNARKANRARAHATAERDETIMNSRVDRAANGILARLKKAGAPVRRSELRRSLRSDLRPEAETAFVRLIDANLIAPINEHEVVHVDTLSTSNNSRSEHVDTTVHVDNRETKSRLAESAGCATVQGSSSQVSEGVPPVQGVPRRVHQGLCSGCFIELPLDDTGRCEECADPAKKAPAEPPKRRALHVAHSGSIERAEVLADDVTPRVLPGVNEA